MAEKVEGKYAGEFLLSEAPGSLSRESITLLLGQNLKVGAVLGRVARGVGRANIPAVVGTGNGVMSNLFAGPDVEKGSYVVTCIAAVANGGTFSVVAPSGKALPNLVLTAGAGASTNYRSSHINFTITDGSTDFAVNDAFTIVVEAGNPAVVGTGNGTISGLSLGRHAIPGRYLVVCIAAALNAGDFEIINPKGHSLGRKTITGGAGGTAVFSDNEQLNATITDGSTDFAAGDKFEVFVFNEGERGKGKTVAWNPVPSAFDGRHEPAGILYAAVDATLADKAAVMIARSAEVKDSDLEYLAAVTAGEKQVAKQRLESLGIAVR